MKEKENVQAESKIKANQPWDLIILKFYKY